MNLPPRLDIGDDGLAVLTLQRPQLRNRLDGGDLDTLQRHLERVAADASVRLLVLAATGPVFCAGYDLGQLGRAGDDGPQRFDRSCALLAALPQPTIARLHGNVHGGATDLALACDFRVGVAGMTLRMPAARIGLHYEAGGLQRAVARLGVAAAKRLFLLGETLDHETLLRIGYLDECVAPDLLDGAVRRIADALRAGAPMALRGMKASIDEIAGGRPDRAHIDARAAACAASADLREGLSALAAKRPPRFSGH